jgi:hypothetical protein
MIVRTNSRNIAAPYQTTCRQQVALTPTKNLGESAPTPTIPIVNGNKDQIDYRSFQFQPLESIQNLHFDNYCGPTPESNWVVRGKLLVGAYPASEDDAETLELITSILKWGITKFVCLQQEVSDKILTICLDAM